MATVEAETLKAFVNTYSIPNVMPFNEKAIEIIFHKANPAIFLWNDDYVETAVTVDEAFSTAVVANKGKGIIFSITKPYDFTGNY